MAHDPGPCGPQFEDWEDLYRDWENKNSAANAAARNAAIASGVAVAVCGGTAWTGVGLLGCATATAAALAADAESIAASLSRNEAAEARNAAQKQYKECTENHKNYYGN